MNEDPELEKIIEDFKARQISASAGKQPGVFLQLIDAQKIATKRSSYVIVFLFLLLSASIFLYVYTHEFNIGGCLIGLIPLTTALLLLHGLHKSKR